MTAVVQSFKTIEVVSVQAQGFRGFLHPMVFDFHAGKNEFIGDNGKGKSSIGELIAWIITGRNIAGKQKEINITNNQSESVIGILTFKDQNGNIHELERKQTSSMSIKLDYDTITQKRLDELIPTDLFLCAFNPIYLLSLDGDVLRKTIASLFPGQTKESILDEMDDYHRSNLEKESFFVDQTNEYLKNRNTELREIDDNRKWLEGYIGKSKEKIVVPPARTFDDAPLLAVQKQLDELSARKPELKNIQEFLTKRSGIQEKLAQVQHQVFGKQAAKAELVQEKALLQQQLKIEADKQYTPFNTTEIEKTLAVLRGDYRHNKEDNKVLELQTKQLEAKHIHFNEGDQCPSCKQLISKESVTILAKELATEVGKEKEELAKKQEEKLKTLADLEKEGKKLLEDIANAKKADEEKQKLFEDAKKKAMDTIDARLKQIDKEITAIDAEEKAFVSNKQVQIQSMQKEIDEIGVVKLEQENARIEREFNTVVAAEKAKLQTEQKRLQTEKEEVVKHETNRKTLEKQASDQVKELELRQKEMEDYTKKEEVIRTKVYLMKNFNAKKIELLNQTIKTHLVDVEIRLQKTIESTGEIKDCFEIFYKGNELKICSTSETIRAGIEISNMVNTLTGVKYPVFVDNAESITAYTDPGFQTIEVRVVKDKPLMMIRGGKEVEMVPSTKDVKTSKPRTTGRASSGTTTAV